MFVLLPSIYTPMAWFTVTLVTSFAPTVPDDPIDNSRKDYGINFNKIDNLHIHEHNHLANLSINEDDLNHNPFTTHHPEILSYIIIEDPCCPFNVEDIDHLNVFLNTLPYCSSNHMSFCMLLWTSVLQYTIAVMS